MAIRNYTSKVEPAQTAGEIQMILASYGASRIAVDYDDNGNAEAVTFVMRLPGERLVSYRIEPDEEGTLQALKADDEIRAGYCNAAQARRTAWRNEKDWLDAQLAKVEATNARLEQLLLGYAVTDDGRTFYERLIQEGEGRLLES